MDKLTDKQALFVKHYAATLNATESARLAGYKGNDKTLGVVGVENLAKPSIRVAIDSLLDKRTMEAEEVLQRLTEHAMIDLADFFDIAEGGYPELNLTKALAAGKTHLIKSIKFDGKTGRATQVYFHDPQNALIHIGKAYGMFRDVVQVDDWRSEAIAGIKAGLYTYEQIKAIFADDSLASELFRQAGVPIDKS